MSLIKPNLSDSGDNPRQDDAAVWLALFDRGLSKEEQEKFIDWLAVDPLHAESFYENLVVWQEFDELEQWKPEHSNYPNPDLLVTNSANTNGYRLWQISGIAAILILGLLSIFYFISGGSQSNRYLAKNEYALSYERHVLEDGTTVELNTGAQATVHFSTAERRVKLLSGEAHFTVTENPSRPFVVEAGDTFVRAVGTAFNVKLSPSRIEVLVTEGKVRLEPIAEETPEGDARRGTLLAVPTLLTEGQRAVHATMEAGFNPEIMKIAEEEIEQRLLWKDQVLSFESEPLRKVILEFNRRNHTQLIITDESIKDLEISAALKPNNLTGFVKLLEFSSGIKAEYRDSGAIYLSKK